MSDKNPLIINWESGNANLKSCNNSDCGITPRYSNEVGFKYETNNGYLKIHTFDKTSQITSTGGLYYLREIYIACNSFNYYNGTPAEPDQIKADVPTKAEVIMVHENSSNPQKKLYICFLLKKVTAPSSLISSKQSFDFVNELMNKSGSAASNWKLNKKLGKNENFVTIIPKTSYHKLSGGVFNNLFSELKEAHEFILFPDGSETEVPNDFFDFLTDNNCNWAIKHTMPNGNEKGENIIKSDVNEGKSDFQRNNEGIGGMMNSGEIGVITECVEVVDQNGIEVSYVDNNKASADWFASYNADSGVSAFLNNPQFDTDITGLAWVIIIIVAVFVLYFIGQMIGNLAKSGKKSAVPPAKVETK